MRKVLVLKAGMNKKTIQINKKRKVNLITKYVINNNKVYTKIVFNPTNKFFKARKNLVQ